VRLSYPNTEDAKRGLKAGLIAREEHDAIAAAIGKRATPPWKTALGGEIFIHGRGSGRDWTQGCIALDDKDIREIYRAIPALTPVEIVP
jgi:L,D-peptidoglycan transpeptidase YkuD (ErfK/YbiS/YcfS/YnhG family)